MTRRTALALLGLCIALRAVSLARPCLSDDEAIYATVAREMLDGRALYRDVVDHKPPGIYVVYAATQAIGGSTGGMVLLHALLIAAVFATGLVLARIVRRHWPGTDPRAPAAAALLWIVYTTTLVDVDALAANCELFMMLPVSAAMAVFLGAGGRLSRHALAGALIGAACLLKYQAGIQLPLLAIALAVSRGEGGVGRRIAAMVAIGAGFVTSIGMAAFLLWRAGALGDAVFWPRFNFAYIEVGTSWSALIQRLAIRGGLVIGSAALLYGLGVAAVVAARREPFVRLITGWLLASGIAVFVGGRFFGHYFHQLTAPLAVLAAPATVRLWQRRRGAVTAAIAVPAGWFYGKAPVMRSRVAGLVGGGTNELNISSGDGTPLWPSLSDTFRRLLRRRCAGRPPTALTSGSWIARGASVCSAAVARPRRPAPAVRSPLRGATDRLEVRRRRRSAGPMTPRGSPAPPRPSTGR